MWSNTSTTRITTPMLLFCVIAFMAMMTISTARPGSYCDLSNHDKYKFTQLIDEDFNDKALNRTVWNVITTDDQSNYDNDRCGDSLCQPGNVLVQDGHLVLRSRREKRQSPTDDKKTYQYTSAAVTTQDKIDIYPTRDTITRVCVRAKLPIGQNTTKDGVQVDTASGLGPLFQLTASNARRIQKDSLSTIADMVDSSPYEPKTYFSCNPDEGQITLLRHVKSDQFTTAGFSWQDHTPRNICQFPLNNHSVNTTTTVTLPQFPPKTTIDVDVAADEDDGFHEWAIERSGHYITYIFDGIPKVTWSTKPSHKMTDLPQPEPQAIAINFTSPFYLSLSTIFGSDATGPIFDEYIPENGWELKIDYVKVSHYGPKEGEQSKERAYQYLLLVAMIVVGVTFLMVVTCCACLRSKNEYYNDSLSRNESSEEFPSHKQPLLVH